MVRYGAVRYGMAWYGAIRYGTVRLCTDNIPVTYGILIYLLTFNPVLLSASCLSARGDVCLQAFCFTAHKFAEMGGFPDIVMMEVSVALPTPWGSVGVIADTCRRSHRVPHPLDHFSKPGSSTAKRESVPKMKRGVWNQTRAFRKRKEAF